jgi:hypothetical protein
VGKRTGSPDEILHFKLVGVMNQVDKGVQHIISSVREPLERIPEFKNVTLVKNAKAVITVKAARREKAEGMLRGSGGRTAPAAGSAAASELDEKIDVIEFTMEWDYIPAGEVPAAQKGS